MTLIAVGPNILQKGYSKPEDADRVPYSFEIMELREALERQYNTDAHLLIYVVTETKRICRINKPGLGHFLLNSHVEPEVQAFFCDVDNPNHADWNDELLAKAKEQYDTLEILQTTGIYHTKRGARFVQPLVNPISVFDVEPYICRWYQDLEDAGVDVDWNCRDWTHMFRLPNVFRDDVPYKSPLMLLDRMRPIELEYIDPRVVQVPVSKSPKGSANPKGPSVPRISSSPVSIQPTIAWSNRLPEVWHERVKIIAHAVAAVQSEWHTLFMAIAGSLITRGIPLEEIPLINQAISQATGLDDRTEDRVITAKSTIERYQAGQPHTGHTKLSELWPNVAEAIDEAFGDVDDEGIHHSTDSDERITTDDILDVSEWLEEKIRRAPAGLTLLGIGNYLHKTQAVLNVAVERANRDYSSPNAKGVRAPKGSKTAIAYMKNTEAIENRELLQHRGIDAKRYFGPLSLRDEKAQPICKYYDVATHLVSGGHSISWEFCEGRDKDRCKYYEECKAKDGVEGPDDARVALGTHNLVGVLSDKIGDNGLLLIEGPLDVLEIMRFSPQDFSTTEDVIHLFDSEYTTAIRPAFDALKIWTESHGDPGVATRIPKILKNMVGMIDETAAELARHMGYDSDLLTCAANAQLPGRGGYAPQIRTEQLREVKDSIDLAEKVGIASKLLGAILQGSKFPNQLVVRISLKSKRDERTLVVARVREPIAKALNRAGPVVVIEREGSSEPSIYSKLIGFEPNTHTLTPKALSHVDRRWYSYSQANKKNWQPQGKLSLKRSLKIAVRAIIDWANENENAKHLCIVSTKVVALALRIAFNTDDKQLLKAWRSSGQSKRALNWVKDQLAPIVSLWSGQITLRHFGALESADDISDIDCLATLGDPWPNMREELDIATYAEDMENWKERAEERCKAELTRSHELPYLENQKKYGRALHIGKMQPESKEWDFCPASFLVPPGRPKNESDLSVDDIRRIVDQNGGVCKTAKRVGCSRRTLHRYLTKKIQPDKKIAQKLLKLECADIDC